MLVAKALAPVQALAGRKALNPRVPSTAAKRPLAALCAGGGSGGGGGALRQGGGGGGSDDSERRQGSGGLALLVAAGLGLQACVGVDAASAKKKQEPTMDSIVDQYAGLVVPVVSNLGFSGVIGAAAAYALKTLGKAVAIGVGLAFAALQGLAYLGVVDVNWSKMHNTVEGTFDANNDGKLDEQDFKIFMKKALGFVAQGVPSVGGFMSGFALGLKM